jgi:hypothetical protein
LLLFEWRKADDAAFQGFAMPDELLTYTIVALNLLVQLMLIRRLSFPPGARRIYFLAAVAIPVFLMVAMRALIAGGLIQHRVVEQSAFEQYVTAAASILLIAGPCLATLAALLDRKRRDWVARAGGGMDDAG